jgi:hypothetical protein
MQRLKQLSPPVRRALLAALLLALLLGGLALALLAYRASPAGQAQALAAARDRWETRSFSRYHLHVQQENRLPLQPVAAGVYPVRSESLDVVERGISQRSVSSFFALIEDFPRTTDFRCGSINIFDCAPPASFSVRVQYDPELGYPRQIELLRTEHPDWSNLYYWRWLWDSGEWQHCANLLCTSTESATIRIVALTPER